MAAQAHKHQVRARGEASSVRIALEMLENLHAAVAQARFVALDDLATTCEQIRIAAQLR